MTWLQTCNYIDKAELTMHIYVLIDNSGILLHIYPDITHISRCMYLYIRLCLHIFIYATHLNILSHLYRLCTLSILHVYPHIKNYCTSWALIRCNLRTSNGLHYSRNDHIYPQILIRHLTNVVFQAIIHLRYPSNSIKYAISMTCNLIMF